MIKARFGICVLAAALVSSLAAQEPSRGATVRLHLRRPLGTSSVTGTLLQVTPDSIIIAPSGFFHRYGYPRSSLAALDVRTRVRATARFVLLGGLAGGAFGAVAAYAGGDDDGSLSVWADGGRTVLGAAIGALTGMAVGAITAARVGEERWRRVDLDQLQVGVSPLARNRLGLGATLSF